MGELGGENSYKKVSTGLWRLREDVNWVPSLVKMIITFKYVFLIGWSLIDESCYTISSLLDKIIVLCDEHF